MDKMAQKYVVFLFTHDGIEEIEVIGKQQIDNESGCLSFARDNFVFNRGSWNYFKKA